MTERERYEKIKKKTICSGDEGTNYYSPENLDVDDYNFLLVRTHAHIELKEGLRSRRLFKEWNKKYNQKLAETSNEDFCDFPQFPDWLLSRLESTLPKKETK